MRRKRSEISFQLPQRCTPSEFVRHPKILTCCSVLALALMPTRIRLWFGKSTHVLPKRVEGREGSEGAVCAGTVYVTVSALWFGRL